MEIVMACPECGEHDSFFDDVLGENVCNGCGLVQVIRPFEETTSISKDGNQTHEPTRRLGSLIMETKSNYNYNQMVRMKKHNLYAAALSEADNRTIVLSQMILSNYQVSSSIKKKIEEYLRSLNTEHVFRGASVEHRAASLTFFILKESKVPMNIREHSRYSMVERKYISRWGKRVAKHFRKSYVFTQENAMRTASSILDRLDEMPTGYRMEAMSMIQFLETFYQEQHLRFSPNKVVAGLWVAGRMQRKYRVTQESLVKASGNTTSAMGLREQVREMQNMFGLSKEDLYSLSVSDFVSGAY